MNKYWLEFFPEEFYPPVKESALDYRDRVNFGFGQISQSRVSIGFLARQIEHILPYTIARVEKIGTLFKDYQVFVYENDSTDNTKTILSTWKQHNNRVSVWAETLSTKFHGQTRDTERMKDMAFYRNSLKSLMLNSWFSPDYVILLDSDIIGGFSYEGIAHSLSYGVDVVGSNSIIYHRNSNDELVRLYYDSYAYRETGATKAHRDEDINPLMFNRGESPIALDSVFGGLAIYKSDVYLNSKYQYKSTDCEHVTLHKQMRNDNKRIIMNPSQIVLYSGTRFYHGNYTHPTL